MEVDSPHCPPLQYSCLENSIDRGAWWTTVLGVAKSRCDSAQRSTRHHAPTLAIPRPAHSAPSPALQPHSSPLALTSWHKCPIPRILKDPVGCTFSYLRKTGMPATWDSAQLSSRGVTMWKGSPLAHSSRGLFISATTWRACRRAETSQPRRLQPRVPLTRTAEREGRSTLAWLPSPQVAAKL